MIVKVAILSMSENFASMLVEVTEPINIVIGEKATTQRRI